MKVRHPETVEAALGMEVTTATGRQGCSQETSLIFPPSFSPHKKMGIVKLTCVLPGGSHNPFLTVPSHTGTWCFAF